MPSILRPKTFLLILGATLVLSGCAASKYQDSPVGVGPGPNDLKKSPCACYSLPNAGRPGVAESNLSKITMVS